MASLPPQIQQADQALYAFFKGVSFSNHLNPINTTEAKRAFFLGAEGPPFAYNPLLRADEFLHRLDKIILKFDHPLAELINQKIYATQLLIYALRDRTAHGFDALARHHRWYPESSILELDYEAQSDIQPLDRPAKILIKRFKKALEERHMENWTIRTDTVMSARVQVDGPKRQLIVHPLALFRQRDIERLIVHEIDVHAQRADNGLRQPLKLFSMGLTGSLITEEGLAMLAEERNGVQSPGAMARQLEVVKAIHSARHMGFRALFEHIRESCGTALAWAIALRVKRGLANPEQPGVYAKDSVYLVGHQRVKDWLGKGGDIRHLYVGDVGMEHPIQLWLDEGWVELKETPRFWMAD
ncbi:MAG: tyrosine/phenylalanine carboxypeptidase domain-containing protein [Myxococcota bacterium]